MTFEMSVDELDVANVKVGQSVEVTADAVIPGFTSRVPVSASIVAAETIIVGKIPDAYTHVVAGDTDLVGLLQDYGAVLD